MTAMSSEGSGASAGEVPTLGQLTADQRVIIRQLEQRTGLVSRWSGRVVISQEMNRLGYPLYNGKKAWNCDIVLHQSRLGGAGRYSTAVHEGLHSLSVGLTETDYPIWKGFEEGVVAALTRLLRDAAVALLQVSEPMENRQGRYYQKYVDALEALRLKTGKAEVDFYLDLLRTPLRDREDLVVQWMVENSLGKTRAQVVRENTRHLQELKP